MAWKLIWQDVFHSWPDGPAEESAGWLMSGGNSPVLARENEKVFTGDYSVKFHQGAAGVTETDYPMYRYSGTGIVAGSEFTPHPPIGVRWHWMKTKAHLNSGVTDADAVFDVYVAGEVKDTITIPTGETDYEHYLSAAVIILPSDEVWWKCVTIGAGVTAVTITVVDIPSVELLYQTRVSYPFRAGDSLKMIGAVNTATAQGCLLEIDDGTILRAGTAAHDGSDVWLELEALTAEFAAARDYVDLTFRIYGNKSGDYWLDDVRLYLETRGRRCIEFFERDYEELKDCFYVDCGLSYQGEPATEITGLLHLVGREVAVLADGVDVGKMTVEEVTDAQGVVLDGKITLEIAASTVQVGLPFKTILETLDIEQPTGEGQTAQGKTQRIHKAAVRILNSLGIRIGTGPEKLEDWPAPRTVFDAPPDLQSGVKEVLFRGGWTKGARVYIETDRPYPLKVLGVEAKMDTHDS